MEKKKTYLDTTEILKLRETKFGIYLFINKKPVKIKIKDRKITNNLTEKQLSFVEDHIEL